MEQENKELDSRLRGNDKEGVRDGNVKKPIFKRWYFWVAVVAVVLIVIVLIGKRTENRANNSTTGGQAQNQNVEGQKVGNQETEIDKEVKFTHQIFDPSKVSHILPMGELNGGYIETQAINGIMINLKKDANGEAEPMDIYAPADLTLEDYAYAPDPLAPNRPVQWHLGFRISRDVKMSFDHISWVTDEIKEVTPPTPNSGYTSPTKKTLI